MDNFTKLPSQERKLYFEAAADNSGLEEHIIEKDFWVCWTLKRLFTTPTLNDHLIFKGGTSLSKVFKVIERFSEDIDVSLSKELLGFTGNSDPEHASSSKQRIKRLEELSQACSTFVKNRLQEELNKSIEDALREQAGWNIEVDTEDKDGQTLLFHYPSITRSQTNYVRPIVRLEFGARSDHWPAHVCTVSPYLSEYVPQALQIPDISVKTLDATRTFWEKATILHSFAHYPEGKIPAKRQSRHYYDFCKLLRSKHKDQAVNDLPLLARVVEHKSIYFRAAWAKYENAKKGTLKVIPTLAIHDALQHDYEQMQEMFFQAPPSWKEIIGELRHFETEFNGTP